MALTVDIEKAFLMIEIEPSDRDMLRFLWIENPQDISSPVLQFRFAHLVFGLRPSPAILGSVITHHLDKYQGKYPNVIQSIRNAFYVDDLISGGDTVEEAYKIFDVARQVMDEAGFNLRKWNSNCAELLSKMSLSPGQPASDPNTQEVHKEGKVHSQFIVRHDSKDIEQTKLLGILWESDSDKLTFCFSELIALLNKLPATRRSLLKVTASIFDPLGILSPFVIKLKVLFQSICRKEVAWDRPLEGEFLKQWNDFQVSLRP